MRIEIPIDWNEPEKDFCEYKDEPTTVQTIRKWKDNEKKLNKDIVNFSEQEIMEILYQWRITTVTTRIKTLKEFYEFCVIKGYIKVNPFKNISIVTIKKKKMRNFISEEKLNTILEIFRYGANPEYNSAVFLSLYEGMLPADLDYLTFDNVDFNNNIVTLKNGKIFKVSQRLADFYKRMYFVNEYHYPSKTAQLINDETELIFKLFKPLKTIDKTPRRHERFTRVIRIYAANEIYEHSELQIEQLVVNDIYYSGLYKYIYDEARSHGYDFKKELNAQSSDRLTSSKTKNFYSQLLVSKNVECAEWRAFKTRHKLQILSIYDELD